MIIKYFMATNSLLLNPPSISNCQVPNKGLETVSNDIVYLPGLRAIVLLQGAFVVALMKADVQAVDGDALYSTK